MLSDRFAAAFESLTGRRPFGWQSRLFDRIVGGDIPAACDIPTGLGKTSVIVIWLLARALADDQTSKAIPRRLVYVVDRRAVVDQATAEAERIRTKLDAAPLLKARLGLAENAALPISTLRGQHLDNREWLREPTASAIIVGTVDMIGSRLLFSGYGVSPKMRPYHAGLLGVDTLVVLDEAHLVPPFQALIEQVAQRTRTDAERAAAGSATLPFKIQQLQTMALSATGRGTKGTKITLTSADLENDEVRKRVDAPKWISMEDAPSGSLADAMAARAEHLAAGQHRVMVFCNSRKVAQGVYDKLKDGLGKKAKLGANIELIVGARRVREREQLADSPVFRRFARLPSEEGLPQSTDAAFLVATSAGEVGVDIDADHMVCDLVAWERMVQRLGRVNRRGDCSESLVDIFVAAPDKEAETPVGSPAVEMCREPFEHAAWNGRHDGRQDGSPGKLLQLRRNTEFQKCAEAATTGEPLRPPLTSELVAAWSMTSLENHTGRPEVAPWIRGWIEEDQPHCEVLWRRHLPVRRNEEIDEAKRALALFFEAAPPHLSEILETEAYRVVDMLRIRAKALLKTRIAEADDTNTVPDSDAGEAPDAAVETVAAQPLTRRAFVAVVLARDGSIEGLLRLEDIRNRDSKRLQSMFANRRVVLDARMSGIAISGLLDPKAGEVPATIDGDGVASIADEGGRRLWSDERLSRSGYGFRVRVGPSDEKPKNWKVSYRRFIDEDAEEVGGPAAQLEWLVEEWVGDRTAVNRSELARAKQPLPEHHQSIERWAGRFAEALNLPEELRAMLVIAARNHDFGKARIMWQRYAGNPDFARGQGEALAKFDTWADPRLLKVGDGSYRHEFGSLHDAAEAGVFDELPASLRMLGSHLIAAHHGYGRPMTFAYDEARSAQQSAELVEQAARNWANLQAYWGAWGLAWWEALLRAADVAASRELPSQEGQPR